MSWLDSTVARTPTVGIPWAYALAMVAAIFVFLAVDYWQPKTVRAVKLPTFERWILFAAAFIGGALGRKLPFALATGEWWTLDAWFMDGKTITTGLVGAYLAVELAKLILGVRTKTGDRFALPLAAALTVGRWGCFFNGCCFGGLTTLPWGVEFATVVGRRHPTQIYESLFHGGLFLFLLVATRSNRWVGHRLQLYLIAYCVYRFLTEWIRPEPQVLLGLTFYQWIVLGFGFGLALQWWFESRQSAIQDAIPESDKST